MSEADLEQRRGRLMIVVVVGDNDGWIIEVWCFFFGFIKFVLGYILIDFI
jgi:hypothetical protein